MPLASIDSTWRKRWYLSRAILIPFRFVIHRMHSSRMRPFFAVQKGGGSSPGGSPVDRQTPVKILPWPKHHLQAVKTRRKADAEPTRMHSSRMRTARLIDRIP